MARPKKNPNPMDEREMKLSYKELMEMMNRVSQAFTTFNMVAAQTMQAASQQITAVNAAKVQLQQFAKFALNKNEVDESSVDATAFSQLLQLLETDKATIAPMGDAVGDAPMYLPMPNMKALKQRKPRKPKDPNAPKRPVTAFFLYLNQTKENVRQGMPEAAPGEVQKKATDNWNALSRDLQQEYKDKYRENFDVYRKQLEDYKNQGGNIDPALLKPDDPEVATEGADDDDASSSTSPSSSSSSESESPAVDPIVTVQNSSKKGNGEKKGKSKQGTEPVPEAGKKRKSKEESSDPSKKKKKTKADEVPVEARKDGYGSDDY